MTRRLLALAAVGWLGGVTGCPASSGDASGESVPFEILTLGMTPALGEAESKKVYEPLATYLATELETRAAIRISHSYRDLNQLIASGEVQVAVLSPLGYVAAKSEMPGLHLLAIPIVKGQASYESYIVARADSPATSVEDLKGKSFGFVDRVSTSGYLYPLAYIKSLGHEPAELFGEIEFTGDHTEVVRRVKAGELDAGATFKTDPELKILARTGRIPSEAFCASPTVPPDVAMKLRELLLNCDRSEIGKLFIAESYMQAFATVEDSYYDEVRRAQRLVQFELP